MLNGKLESHSFEVTRPLKLLVLEIERGVSCEVRSALLGIQIIKFQYGMSYNARSAVLLKP